METLGANIQRLRLEQGLSVMELAQQVGMQATRLDTVEGGAMPRVPTLHRIADALGVSVDALLPPATTTGARIARWRMLRGWTGQALAARTGIALGNLSTLEHDNGGPQGPLGSTLQRIAQALDVEVTDLIGGEAATFTAQVQAGGRPRGRAEAKQLAKGLGVRVQDVAALAKDNDPFLCGSPRQQREAEWFAALWRKHQFRRGIHLRAIHYILLSQRGEQKVQWPEGDAYENRDSHYQRMSLASRYARILGLVDPTALEDHRNPATPMQIWDTGALPEPEWGIEELPTWLLPRIDWDLFWARSFPLPTATVSGYGYVARAQPYHLELWIEKSTMDGVLYGPCQEYGALLVTSVGFQSVTNVVRLLQRIARLGKPVRIFYISDYDPAGDAMPVAVARQVEYWCERFAPDVDIKLQPLALTKEQVDAYALETTPIKDTDRRRESWEDLHGEGAVELDALEAIYPGTLARLVRDALAPYWDATLERRLDQTGSRARSLVSRHLQDNLYSPTSEAREELAADVQEVTRRYREQLQTLAKALHDDLAPMRERAETLRAEITETIDGLEILLPARPEPAIEEPDESDWLLDVQRPYLPQLKVYKARKRKQGGSGDELDHAQDDDDDA